MMQRILAATLVAGIAAIATPAAAQSPAAQPDLTAPQALQLFAEAGFPVVDGRPENRCGNPANPRVAFIDLNGDRVAEAHVADVDPACYGRPGAYFAILAQANDGSWRKLIGEDGIVGFVRSRTQGWNDLSLEAADSACPGARRFNGTDYGAPTACAIAPVHALASANSPATGEVSAADSGAPGNLTGTRTEQMAQLFRNVVRATRSRSWDAAIAAFPGAQWQARTTHAPNWQGSTITQDGTIPVGGAVYGVTISGTAARVNDILFDSPGDDLMDWEPVAASMNALGMEARNIGCHSPTGFGWVSLVVDGHRAILHKSLNYGTLVPSTDVYEFPLDDPFDGRTEAEVAADRSLC